MPHIVCQEFKGLSKEQQDVFVARLLHAIRYDSDCFKQAENVILFGETFTQVYKDTAFANIPYQPVIPTTEELSAITSKILAGFNVEQPSV